jgi:hypothetical protein
LRESPIQFTGRCEHHTVRKSSKRRFGAILWQAAADIDNAIKLVQAFDDPDDAVHLLTTSCAEGEQWAVVDLRTMGVVAAGSGQQLSLGC